MNSCKVKNPRMTYKCRRKVIDAMEIALFIKYQAPVLAGIGLEESK